MSEWNTIYDRSNNIICILQHGVAWSKSSGQRLGEYDHEFAYDNDGKVIAKLQEGRALSVDGEEIGYIVNNNIIIGSRKVGQFIGSKEAAAASVAFIFNAVVSIDR